MHLTIVLGLILLGALVTYVGAKTMGQTEDLRSAVSQLGTDLSEAVSRVEAKIDSLGEVDPDLTADIAAIREASTKLDALAADDTTPGGS